MSEQADTETELEGARGTLIARTWRNPDADHVVLIAHGYGEHIGRYEHVAERLVANGAVVVGADHLGHGRSAGERALVEEGEDLTNDLHVVADLARREGPRLPLVLLGHSMGGLIATRFAQRYRDELTALVISAPVIGGNPGFTTICPTGSPRPPTSNINVSAIGDIRPNSAIVRLGQHGRIDAYMLSTGHLLADKSGYLLS